MFGPQEPDRDRLATPTSAGVARTRPEPRDLLAQGPRASPFPKSSIIRSGDSSHYVAYLLLRALWLRELPERLLKKPWRSLHRAVRRTLASSPAPQHEPNSQKEQHDSHDDKQWMFFDDVTVATVHACAPIDVLSRLAGTLLIQDHCDFPDASFELHRFCVLVAVPTQR